METVCRASDAPPNRPTGFAAERRRQRRESFGALARKAWRPVRLTSLLVALCLGLSGTLPPPSAVAQLAFCLGGAASHATGDDPRAVAIADFNHDGKPDLAVANFGVNSVAVLLGVGDGTFQAPAATYLVASRPASLAVADVNGDGFPDIAVGHLSGSVVDVLLGRGDGSFRPTRQFAAGGHTSSVAIGDLNHDGKPDLVATDVDIQSVAVLLGNGDGTFPSPILVPGGDSPQSVGIADVDGDGNADIVVANLADDDVSVLRGNGDGTFVPPSSYAAGDSPVSLTIRDVDGDGFPDLIVANLSTSSVSVLLNNRDGTFRTPLAFAVGTGPQAVTATDLDGNGTLDLVVAGDGGISTLLGNGDGTFQSHHTISVSSGPRAVSTDDFDGDGRPDLAVATPSADAALVLRSVCDAPPSIGVPPPQTTVEDVALTFASPTNAITVSDPVAGSRGLQVRLTVSNGRITLGSTAGLSGLSGHGTSVVTFSGSQSAVTTALNGLTYSPFSNFQGADALALAVDDTGYIGTGVHTDARSVAITVTPVNDAPRASNDTYGVASRATLNVAVPGLLANDTDSDSPTLTAVKVTDPTNGVLSLNPNGGFTYTPNPGFVGTDSFTYQATDGMLPSNTATVTIVVTNAPPAAQADVYSVGAGATFTIPAPGVLANDIDPESGPLTAVVATNPGKGSLTLQPNGSFSYTSNPGFAGSDTFTYRASDGTTVSNDATVTIVVTNTAPVAQADVYPITAGATLTVPGPGVLANDVDPDAGPLTAAIVSNTGKGSVSLNANGGFSYTPNAGFAGLDTFTYRASDGIATSNDATVTIVVTLTQCTTRPNVRIVQTPTGGKLNVHVETTPLNDLSPNPLREVRFGTFQNARVTLNGQAVTSGQIYTVPANGVAVDFAVERLSPGQATTVPFTVIDGCGVWPTFVGGGTSAGF